MRRSADVIPRPTDEQGSRQCVYSLKHVHGFVLLCLIVLMIYAAHLELSIRMLDGEEAEQLAFVHVRPPGTTIHGDTVFQLACQPFKSLRVAIIV